MRAGQVDAWGVVFVRLALARKGQLSYLQGAVNTNHAHLEQRHEHIAAGPPLLHHAHDGLDEVMAKRPAEAANSDG